MTPLNTRRCYMNPFKQHKWGSWYNKEVGLYHSICCSRCGLWYGDFVHKFPHLKNQYYEQQGDKND